MTLNEFFSKYLGKSVQYNVSCTNKYQCVDWVKCFCKEFLMLNVEVNNWAWGDAKDWFTNPKALQYFIAIKNTPTFVPKAGDICVFGKGTFGHLSVATGIGNDKRFVTIDQNVTGKYVTCEFHDYTKEKFIGVLRLK